LFRPVTLFEKKQAIEEVHAYIYTTVDKSYKI